MANYELSKFYEKTVLKPDERVLNQLKEEALAIENTENKKLYVSLGEMYKESVLRVDETVVNPDLTDVYLNNLDALTDEQKKQIEQHPEYKKRLPHKLSLNQKRAIFESMSNEQYLKIQRERLGLENGMINPSDGGGNIDQDYVNYIRTANVTDPFARNQLFNFITGAKALGIWQSIVCWPLRLNQNIQTGSTVYSLGGFGSYPGTLVNTPTRELNGIYFQSLSGQYISTTLGTTVTAYNAGIFVSADTSQTTTSNVLIANRDIYGNTDVKGLGIGVTTPAGTVRSRISDGTSLYSTAAGPEAQTPNFSTYSIFSDGISTNFYQNGTYLAPSSVLTPVLSAPFTRNYLIGNNSFNSYYNGRIAFAMVAFGPVNGTAFHNLYQSTLGSGELDAPVFLANANITNPTYQSRITNFVTGIKNLGLWYNMVAWPMRQSLNKGSGSTVYSLGGYKTANGTMNGSASWTPGGITFTGTSDYIDYGTFNVAVSSGGFNIHTMFSQFGPPISNSENFQILADTSAAFQVYVTTGVSGPGTSVFQVRNINNYRIHDDATQQSSNALQNKVGQDVAYSWIPDYLTSTTLSSSVFQYNGVTANNTGLNIANTPAGGSVDGNYILRTIGRTNVTNTPYPNSRISYLLAFQPGIGMTSQTMSAVYTLCQNTLNQGDPDVEAYVAATGASDTTISTFVSGIKAQGLWYNMVSWPLISTQNKGFGTVAYPLGGLYGGGLSLSGTLVSGASWSLSGVTSLVASAQGISSTIGSLTLSAESMFAVSRAINSGQGYVNMARNSTGGTQNGMNLRSNDTTDTAAIQQLSGLANNISTNISLPSNTPNNTQFRARMVTANVATTLSANLIRFETIPVISSTNLLSLSGMLTNTDPLWIGRRAAASGTSDNQVAFASVFTSDISALSSTVYNLYKTTLGSNLNLP